MAQNQSSTPKGTPPAPVRVSTKRKRLDSDEVWMARATARRAMRADKKAKAETETANKLADALAETAKKLTKEKAEKPDPKKTKK